MKKQRLILRTAVLLLLPPLLAAAPLFLNSGFLNTRGGGDSPFLLQRTHQLVTALLDSHFPVRWMPDAAYGYGYPFFNYYAPLSIYIVAFFRLLGFSYVFSIKLAQLAGFLTAHISFFYLANRWFKNNAASFLAATAFTFAPFHMVNVYVRGDSLAEFWAIAFYPLIFLAADSWRTNSYTPRWRIIALSLSYASLILSHNISALIFSPFLGLYLLLIFYLRWDEKIKIVREGIISLILALTISAWFWLPALMEQNLVQLAPVTTGYFHFSQHFRALNLIQTTLFFSYDPIAGIPFRMGLIQAAAITAALLLIVRYYQTVTSKPLIHFLLFTLLLSTWMITPLSTPLWQHLPLLPFTQFPWRFLSVQAFLGSFLIGVIPLLLGRYAKYSSIFLSSLLMISSLAILQPEFLPLSDLDITSEKLAEYEWFTGNIGTTISAEYLPNTVQPRPWNSNWLIYNERNQAISTPAATITLQERKTQTQIWHINTPTPTSYTITFPTLYWLGWQASINQQPLPTTAAPGSGLLTLTLPESIDCHTTSCSLKLQLKRAPIRLTAELISLLTLLIVLFLIHPFLNYRSLLKITVGLIGLKTILFLLSFIPTVPTTAPYSWDFAQLGYLHPQPKGILFTHETILTDYQYQISPESLTISMNWLNPPPETIISISLISPADTRFPFVEPEITISSLLTTQMTINLPIPPHTPGNRYLPRLTSPTIKPLLQNGASRTDLYLKPILIPIPISTPELPPSPHLLDAQLLSHTITDQSITFNLAWWNSLPTAENGNLSLRIWDDKNQLHTQWDGQPGYGFLPQISWPPGQWSYDSLTLPLTNQLPDQGYVSLELYTLTTGKTTLYRRLALIENKTLINYTPQFTPPTTMRTIESSFSFSTPTPIFSLQQYNTTKTNETLDLTLLWQQGSEINPLNFTRFVHLVDLENETIIYQQDSYVQNNSYPTSQWQPHEFISETISFPLQNLPLHYEFRLGWYLLTPPNQFTPLTANEQHLLDPNGRLRLIP